MLFILQQHTLNKYKLYFETKKIVRKQHLMFNDTLITYLNIQDLCNVVIKLSIIHIYSETTSQKLCS